MKAKVAESRVGGEADAGGAVVGGGVRAEGKIQKASVRVSQHQHQQQRVEENQEIKAYLNKLQELVPFMPKNRKLTKLEVITHVIDYIRDLRQTLGLPPCISEGTPFDMQSAMIMSHSVNPPTNTTPTPTVAINPQHPYSHHSHVRQPLCVISNQNNCSSSSGAGNEILAVQLMDKSPFPDDVDTRPVSC